MHPTSETEVSEAAHPEQDVVSSRLTTSRASLPHTVLTFKSTTNLMDDGRLQSSMRRISIPPPQNIEGNIANEHIDEPPSAVEATALASQKHDFFANKKVLFHHNHMFKEAWDVLILTAGIFSILMYPVQIAFFPLSRRTFVSSVILETLFLVDIPITFASTHRTKAGVLVRNVKPIGVRYIKGRLVFDALSALPIELSSLAYSGPLHPNLNVINLIKLFKAYKLWFAVRSMEFNSRVHPTFMRFVRHFCLIYLISHISGCLWYIIGERSSDSIDSWVIRIWGEGDRILDSRPGIQYLVSVYYSLTTLTTVGYGDISPRTSQEIGFSMILFLVGALLFSYLTGGAAALIAAFDRKNSQYRANMSALITFCRAWRVSAKTQKKIIQTMTQKWHQPQEAQSWNWCRQHLPAEARYMIMSERYAELLKKAPVFRLFNKCPKSLKEVVASFQPVYTSRGEYLNRQEDNASWYIVLEGAVEAISANSQKRLALFKRNHTFGEITIFYRSALDVQFRCVEKCRLLQVEQQDLLSAIADVDELFECFLVRSHWKLSTLRRMEEKNSKTSQDNDRSGNNGNRRSIQTYPPTQANAKQEDDKLELIVSNLLELSEKLSNLQSAVSQLVKNRNEN